MTRLNKDQRVGSAQPQRRRDMDRLRKLEA